MNKVRKVLKWLLVFLLIIIFFGCFFDKNYVGTIILILLILLVTIPSNKIKERIRLSINAKTKTVIIILGILATFISIGSSSSNKNNNVNVNQNQVVPKTGEQNALELSDDNKRDLQEVYLSFMAIPEGADAEMASWKLLLESGASAAEAYLKIDDLIALNSNVKDRAANLIAPTYLSKKSKDNFNKAKEDLGVAYYSRNEALEQAKVYLNKQDLEALGEFRKQLNLADSFALSAVSSMTLVLLENKVEVPTIE